MRPRFERRAQNGEASATTGQRSGVEWDPQPLWAWRSRSAGSSRSPVRGCALRGRSEMTFSQLPHQRPGWPARGAGPRALARPRARRSSKMVVDCRGPLESAMPRRAGPRLCSKACLVRETVAPNEAAPGEVPGGTAQGPNAVRRAVLKKARAKRNPFGFRSASPNRLSPRLGLSTSPECRRAYRRGARRSAGPSRGQSANAVAGQRALPGRGPWASTERWEGRARRAQRSGTWRRAAPRRRARRGGRPAGALREIWVRACARESNLSIEDMRIICIEFQCQTLSSEV